ncbi:hypothetical protein J6590_093277 [Homalodisca vitripennis]|nr:hypothetical protein J6590_093277 [Homalodisca vitripennis]
MERRWKGLTVTAKIMLYSLPVLKRTLADTSAFTREEHLLACVWVHERPRSGQTEDEDFLRDERPFVTLDPDTVVSP